MESLSEKSCLKTANKQKKQRRTVKILRCSLFDYIILAGGTLKSQGTIFFSTHITIMQLYDNEHFAQNVVSDFLRKTTFENLSKFLL